MRAAEISHRLAQNAEAVASMLLPSGKRKGVEWECGSVSGEEGSSLKVHLSGPKAGIWKDFSADHGGDLLDLWAQTRQIPLTEAMDQARAYLGVKPVTFHQETRHATLSAPTDARPATAPVLRWLTQTRKLNEASIKAYRIGERKGDVLLPSFTPEGELQFVKYRALDGKRFHAMPGARCCLFGWQAIPAQARSVVICEGELDAVAWHSAGFPALSVTNGASSLEWLEVEYDRLERFDEIYLSFDMDEAGQRHVEGIAERLGRERTLVVELPRKDANECLIAGDDLPAALKRARTLDPPELRRVDDYRAEVHELLSGGKLKVGVPLPWDKGDGFAFGAAELTIIAGPTGNGKSEVANQLTLHAMRAGLRACVASLEFHPARWLRNIVRQAGAIPMDTATAQFRDSILDWLDERCWLYGKRGTVKSDHLIEVFSYAARRYGCRWFLVDNLAKCGISEDDYPAQKELADKLGDFANDHRAHVILVCHMRKDGTGITAIKGSGGIADMADNVWSMWRNKAQEERKRLAEQAGVDFIKSEPDAVFKAWKVRDGESEPSIALWWDSASHQFLPYERARPIKYVSFQARATA